jgi:hypothetical protein
MIKLITNKRLLEGIEGLARSQGLYSRIIRNLYNEYETDEMVLKVLDDIIKENNIQDLLDFVFMIEC